MKNFIGKLKIGLYTILASAIIAASLVMIYGISWLAICGVIKLITMIIGCRFNWISATIIWVLICFIRHLMAIGREQSWKTGL